MTRMTVALLHFIPAGMLALAIGRWPYGYYMLLRVVVLAAGLLIAGLIYQRDKGFTVWVALFVIVAFIFNPVVPLQMTRGVWSILNIVAAGLFITHFLIRRREGSKSKW